LEKVAQEQRLLSEPIKDRDCSKIDTGFKNLNYLFGGGMRYGSIFFIYAAPGTGKTTLLSQMAAFQQKAGRKVYFFSGEETMDLVKKRADRLGILDYQPLLFFDKDIMQLSEIVRSDPPDILIVDTIQTLVSSHIHRLTNEAQASIMSKLRKLTTMYRFVTWIVGHVRKDMHFSGPEALAHLCDVFIEARRGINSEIILTTPEKNRFGPIDQRAVLRMTEKGLIEKDQQETGFILRHTSTSLVGLATFVTKIANDFTTDEITITASAKDSLLLVGGTNNHANFLTSIICSLFEDFHPAFIVRANLSDKLPKSADLAIMIAILSKFYNKAIQCNTAFIASIDGSGKLLPVPDMSSMVQRAKDQGYVKVFGANPIGTQQATWETADTIKEVWKLLGF